ncbi:MAG: SUMF1/EgtB/PvdO family nonheme iron enzyme, partial [bacterium]|nr:SUMF1/EgtB/PvdO family nonheme iron enzyme [bacterium]
MAAEKTPDKQAMNVNANGDVTMKGVALGNDNQIVTDVKAAGHVVQAGKYANVQIIDGGYYDVKVYTLPADREDTRSWKQRREALRQVTDEPYKFLRYYETSDADLFFGRDAIADRIIEKLFPYKLVLMNGKSGSGKTSLINAGLLPRLMDRGYLTFVFRDYGSPAGDEDCGSPTDLLKNAIMGLKELDLDLSDCPDFACVLRRAATEMKRPIAVFLDQFERFFLNLPEKARRQFVHEIKACFDTFTGEELDLVISIREEFYGQLGEFWELIPEFHTQSFPVYLKPLNPEEAKEAILGPLGKVSTKIDYDPDFLEKVLLPALMRSEEKNSSGSEQVEPTHLQIVCNTLYDSVKTREKERIERGRVVMIGRELYDDLGGVKGILANYLTDKIKQYGGVEEKAKRMLKQMIVPGREESLRGFVTVEQLHERLTGAITREEVEKLVEKLVDDRLVEKKELEGEAMYSLTHEYMANMVNSWYDVDELELQRAREFFKRSLSDWKLSRSLIPRKRFKEIKKFKKQLELEAVGQKLFRLSSIKYSAVSCVIVLLILALGAVFMNQSYHKLYLIPQDIGRLRVETAQGTDLPATHVKIFRITGNGEQESVYNGKEIPFTAKLPKGLYYIEVPRGKYLVRSPAKIGGYPNYASPVLLRIPLEKLSDDIIKDMVFVPEGRFLAGEDPSDQEHVDERTVMLESFYLDTYEVSNGEYRQFLAYMDQNPSSRFMLYSDEP